MAVIKLNNSDRFEDIWLAATYVSIGHLSHYNFKLRRDWSKIKEIGCHQLRAF